MKTIPAPGGSAASASTWRVPFHRAELDEAALTAVEAVLRSGWLTTGSQSRGFETAFAEHLGGEVEAVAVNSGTAALHLGLEALGVQRGDLVITTPYTFTATSEVISHLGADPLFIDVDPVTGNLTADRVDAVVARLQPSVRARITALVPVHIAGFACDMTALQQLATQHGWGLVDDAAHALPSTHDRRLIGTLGDVTAFSFYVTKTLCTGEGGMAVTRDPDLAARMRVMRLHGIDRDVFDRYTTPDAWAYEVVAAGFKYNLTDIAAAIGLTQLRSLDTDQARRAAIATAYSNALATLEGIDTPPMPPPGDQHAWHLYPLRVRDGAAVRGALIRQLASRGIGASVHFIPLHHHRHYQRTYRLNVDTFPDATRLFQQEVSLPIFPAMTDEQVQMVVEAIPAALADARSEVSLPTV